jgi:hypothetical protein
VARMPLDRNAGFNASLWGLGSGSKLGRAQVSFRDQSSSYPIVNMAAHSGSSNFLSLQSSGRGIKRNNPHPPHSWEYTTTRQINRLLCSPQSSGGGIKRSNPHPEIQEYTTRQINRLLCANRTVSIQLGEETIRWSFDIPADRTSRECYDLLIEPHWNIMRVRLEHYD